MYGATRTQTALMSRYQRRRIAQALFGSFVLLVIGMGLRLGPLPPPAPERAPFRTTLVAVGDMVFDRYTRPVIEARGADTLLGGTVALLTSADIAMANLETPLTTVSDPAAKDILFASDPAIAWTLKAAGFDLVNLANNHTMDQGPAGLVETRMALDQAGVEIVGAGASLQAALEPVFLNSPSGRVAVLGFSDVLPHGSEAHSGHPGVAPADMALMSESIRAAQQQADWVVVHMHWGIEYTADPEPRQRELAHLAIDAGADVVIGGHPHTVQGVEIYRNRPVMYSLGNFVFDQVAALSQETAVAVLYFNSREDWRLTLRPARIHNSQPTFLSDGLEWHAFVARETRLSEKLGSAPGLSPEGWLVWDALPAAH